MTIALTDLAAELDVEPGSLEPLVDQLVGIDGTAAVVASDSPVTLTPGAAEAIRDQLAAAGRDPDLLAEVTDATAAVGGAQRGLEDAQARRDAVVRAALDCGERVAAVAAAAGLSRERVYQIRDGRR